MSNVAGTMITLTVIAIYFLPTIVILSNKNKTSKMPTILVNFFFGITVIGWIIALILACGKDAVTQVIINNNTQNKEKIEDTPTLQTK